MFFLIRTMSNMVRFVCIASPITKHRGAARFVHSYQSNNIPTRMQNANARFIVANGREMPKIMISCRPRLVVQIYLQLLSIYTNSRLSVFFVVALHYSDEICLYVRNHVQGITIEICI